MTPLTSDTPVADLTRTLLRYQKLHSEAVRRADIPAANRHILKVLASSDALAATPRGKDVLENLLDHPNAYVRLRAANRVLKWAPDRAIPVLGRLLVEEFEAEISGDEKVDIRLEASGSLFRHFGVRDFDRNRLIGPLRAYGIEIPHRPPERWT